MWGGGWGGGKDWEERKGKGRPRLTKARTDKFCRLSEPYPVHYIRQMVSSGTLPALLILMLQRQQLPQRPLLKIETAFPYPLPNLQAVRHGLMTSLILAYGIMILRDGLFHSDP